ncbi:MAG TPA: carboxypeptidase-like regulatory domain-containing protein, partial [Vicinamibacterales bacterium]
MRIASLIVAAVVGPVMLAGQTPRDAAAPFAIGQGVIAGTVVADDADGRPVRRAVVTLNGADLNGERKTVTDDTGHFAVSGLPAGRYALSVSKAGWVTTYYGSKHQGRPVFGESPIVLQAGERLTTVALRLLHGSAVTGVITDAFGRPAINAQVRLLPMRVQNGQHTVDPMGGQAMGMIGPGAYGYTDDRGIYRLYGVLPGDYLVVASNFEGSRGEDIQQLTPDDLQAARRALQPGQSSSPTSAA